ncbi:MAG: EamA family transporter [Candidatus Paceibacterota bacterium]
MNNWFLLSLVAPILWAIVNHIDKYMLFRYFKEKGVEALLAFSCLSSIIVLPFILFFYSNEIFSIPIQYYFILILLGIFSSIAFYFYLKAVDTEEVSIVIPLFQLLPIITYVLSYFVLGESLTINQLLYSFIIVVGAFILSVEIDIDKSFIFKKKVLFLVIGSSFFYALNDVIFKKIALVEEFWVVVFWQYLGLFLFGFGLIIFSKKFKIAFKDMIMGLNFKFASINIFSEILFMLGGLATSYAFLLAPVVLVLVVGTYQPLFVFLFAILMTIFLPKYVMERISKGHIIHRLISIIIILIGSYLLYTTSTY